jgi:hypothetical protein
MVVAFHFPHNEGVVYGIFDNAGLDSGLALVDLYEVDGKIRTLENVTDAQQWLMSYKAVTAQGEVKPNIIYDIPMDELNARGTTNV